MLTFLLLALAIMTEESSARHVRSTDAKILTLIDAGISRSATFRSLIATLNESDVIVYIEPNLRRQTLGGYLAHSIVAEGQHRYLRIAASIAGSDRRLVSLIAHELQHAVEVAQAPDVRDPKSLARLFSRRAIAFGCRRTGCFETRAAQNVEQRVKEELAFEVRDDFRAR